MKPELRTTTIRKLASGVAGLCAVLVFAQAATAQQQAENLGTFRFWTAWQASDESGQICYISSQPQDARTDPPNRARDPIHFLVLHRKGAGVRNEVQTIVGYPLDPDSTPRVTIDGQAFDMVVEGSAAWLAPNGQEGINQVEAGFVEAMKGGIQMVVMGRSSLGTDTTDTYSLSGVTDAMAKIDEACA